jgi:hypothetical protein
MAYQLTLTRDERRAFDWVGDRYHAGTISDLLRMYCTVTDDAFGWDDDVTLTYVVPEWVAWQINDLAELENHAWPCFGEELKAKMVDFCGKIV